jgi:sterol desaturase/sphingolipid hydroxylase (fatty acid hydroxylase superfamily)
LQAIHSRHHHVKDDQAWRRSPVHALQCFFTAASGLHMVVLYFEQSLGVTKNTRLIIDE